MKKLDKYLDDTPLSVPLSLLGSVLHVKRPFIALGLMVLVGLYLTFGWGNDVLCNLIATLVPLSATIGAIRSPTTRDHRYLLVYWMVYATFDYIEIILHYLMNSVMLFYFLVKCMFLLWFLSSGSKLIVSIFGRDMNEADTSISGHEPQMDSAPNLFENSDIAKMIAENNNPYKLSLSSAGVFRDSVHIVVNALKNSTTLISLDLTCNILSEVGIRDLAEVLRSHPVLTKLSLCNNSIGSIGLQHPANSLKENKTLTNLDLSMNILGDDGVKHMVECLHKNTGLRVLGLSSVAFGSDGMQYLSEALAVNTTLTDLEIKIYQLDVQGVKSLIAGLQKNTTLKTLIYPASKLGDEAAPYFVDYIRNNKSLTKLNLAGTKFSPISIESLLQALSENTALKIIDLSSHEMIGKAIESVTDVLKKNKTLEELILCENRLGVKPKASTETPSPADAFVFPVDNYETGYEGIKDFAEALGGNQTLIKLDLAENRFGPEGARHMANALKVNTRLADLSLNTNQIEDAGTGFLAETLHTNKTLLQLDLGYNRIEDNGLKTIANALQQNNTLTKLAHWATNFTEDAQSQFSKDLANHEWLKIQF